LDVIWSKLWHISGKNTHISVPGISVGSNKITSQVMIANKVGSHFTSVLSDDSFSPAFKHIRDNAEACLLNFIPQPGEPYNGHFSMDTLLAALR
jgi:hypothetical protein